MMNLTFVLEADVEDIDEAKAKTKALQNLLAVYPFVRISSNVSELISVTPESEEPQ